MASALYPQFKLKQLNGNAIDLDTDTIKARLVSTTAATTFTEAYNAADDFINDITVYGGADPGYATDPTLTCTVALDGVSNAYATLNANDITFSSVTQKESALAHAVVLYKDTGSATTSPLIAWIEFTAVTPNGGDITISWENSDATYGDFIFAI